MRPIYFPFHFGPLWLHEPNQKAESFSMGNWKGIDKKVKIQLVSWIWSLSVCMALPRIDWKDWEATGCSFSLKKKKRRRKEKCSLPLCLWGQLHTLIHRSVKYVWCYTSVCSGAMVLYKQRHKPVNLGFIARSARSTVQELKHTSLCHQPKRPREGLPLLLSQCLHLIDSCSHIVSAMATLYEFVAFDKDGIVYNNVHVS